jgi:streptogramin lyase/4-amino-4-deoxy-L-arabinose transferase-like glycosyltransferase
LTSKSENENEDEGHTLNPLMRRPRTIRNFLIGSLALLLALGGQQLLEAAAFWEAGLLFGAALLLFVGAARTFLWNPQSLAHPQPFRPDPLAWWRLLPLVAALGLGGFALREMVDVERPTPLFWQLYLTSVLLFVGGALLLDLRFPTYNPRLWGERLRRVAHPPVGIVHSPVLPRHGRLTTGHWSLALLLGILLLATFLRLWRFDELPFGTWYDEAENGMQALRILENPTFRPIFVGSIHAPSHYLYLIVAAFEAFGVSTQSIRLVSVVMGLATVLAGYLAGRELLGRAGGLMLAFVVAVSRWNINFSRIGMYNASTPLFELLTIGLLLRGLRRGRYSDFALAGLSLGLGLCFYAAFQLFVGVIGLFLLALILFERGFLRRVWLGLILMGCTALLVIAPVIKFAYEKPDIYFERTKDTSIFANKAPDEQIPALLENVRKHLLMFNYWGDPNGRHNLPGEPMLDPYSGALLVLGLGLSLWQLLRPPWRAPDRGRAFLLLLWLGIPLLGGILSLDFEAPQSLRAIGSQPAAFLLATLPICVLWQTWRGEGGRYTPNLVIAPLALLLALLAYSNARTYFVAQAGDFASWNAFSTPESITANLLRQLDPQTDAYVISFFHGHPTLNFLARGVPRYKRIETTDHLPLPWPADRPIALILNADSRSLFDEAKRYYPNAHFEEFRAPFGGPAVVYYARLSPPDLAGVQGLMGRYYSGEDWSGPPLLTRQEPTISFDWTAPPLPAPFSAEWEGVLRVETYGPHQFFLQTPAYAELHVGETQILSGTGELAEGVVLAQGNHTLRVRAVGGTGPFSLSWRPPDRGPELIPATALYVPPVSSQGLLGRYFPNDSWQAPEAFARIDPNLGLYFHITPLPRPYTVEWQGKIAIPQAGAYRFGLESIDEATLWIDEQQIVASSQPNVLAESAVELSQGLHDIRVRYTDRTDHTHINLYWTPPGSNMQLVPPEALFPPQGTYERVTLPSLTALVFNTAAPGAPMLVSQPLAGDLRAVQTGLSQPRGIAAGPDGTIYVADTGNRRVLVLTQAGQVRTLLDGGERPFLEPFDLATDGEDNLYVLDAQAGRVAIYDGQHNYLRDLPAPPDVLERARGLHVDPQGRIWIAHTPGGRVVALDQAGQPVQEIPVWPGEGSQPVDVIVGLDGAIFVADAGLHKLVQFDRSGRRLLAWEMPPANTLDGGHLAVDGAGRLYLSQPEKAQILQLSPAGEQIGSWLIQGLSVGGAAKPVGIAVDASGAVWGVDSLGGNAFVIEPQEQP